MIINGYCERCGEHFSTNGCKCTRQLLGEPSPQPRMSPELWVVYGQIEALKARVAALENESALDDEIAALKEKAK